MFASKATSLPHQVLLVWFLALPANIRLGWWGLPGTSALAYFVPFKCALHFGRLLALPINIILCLKGLSGISDLANFGSFIGDLHIGRLMALPATIRLCSGNVYHGQPALAYFCQFKGAPNFGRLLALPTNVRLCWKSLPGTSALAYLIPSDVLHTEVCFWPCLQTLD